MLVERFNCHVLGIIILIRNGNVKKNIMHGTISVHFLKSTLAMTMTIYGIYVEINQDRQKPVKKYTRLPGLWK